MATIDKITLPSTGVTYDIKDNVSGYVTAQTAPVTSVNGMTGDVVVGGGGGSYTATSPIDITNDVISHEDSGVTAGTYDGSSEGKGSWTLPSFTVDAKGHITSASDLGIQIPNASSDTYDMGGFVSGTQFTNIANSCDTSLRIELVTLTAGQTSVTKTITPYSTAVKGSLTYVNVVGVFSYDATTFEKLEVDYSWSNNPTLYSTSNTVTISIASAYAHDIKNIIIYKSLYGM